MQFEFQLHQSYRAVVIMIIALLFVWVDSHTTWLKPARYYMGYVVAPTQELSTLPSIISDWLNEATYSRDSLLNENQRLKAHNMILQQQIQRQVSLEVENIQLRELFQASEIVDDKVLITSVVDVNPDPYIKQVTINKGAHEGVFIGQPVLDAHGLLGQVIDVMPYSSRVLMLADSNHTVPVQVTRNGVRAIASGTGSLSELELIYVPITADIKEGDLLVSSGLGQRYPKGYPVATVSAVNNIPGEAFLQIKAKPSAKLDRSRYLMLVFRSGSGKVPPKSLWQESQK